MTERCVECGRVFDLLDENDVDELAYGHDCEVIARAEDRVDEQAKGKL